MTQTETMGKRIAAFRKRRGLTQDQLAEQLGISAQAVSKWETDLSCPDIGLLPQLAEILEVNLDDLFGVEKKGPAAILAPEQERRDPDRLIFRIVVDSADGDKVRVNLPLMLLRALDGGTCSRASTSRSSSGWLRPGCSGSSSRWIRPTATTSGFLWSDGDGPID